MHGRPRSSFRVRYAAAALTLAAHALFVLLLVIGDWRGARQQPARDEPEGVWITLAPLAPATPPASNTPPEQDPEQRPAPATTPPPPTTTTAITLPATAPPADQPDQAATEATPDAPAPAVDWRGEAAKLATRFAEEQDRPKTFSPPPAVMRKPCKPRDSSFEWKSDQKSSGSAALTLGWEPPPPNKHLFDDMLAGKTPRSSVPDPDTCE